METLKPCPFCGSKDIKVRNIMDAYAIGCPTTDCLGQLIHNRTYISEELAVRKWNERVGENPLQSPEGLL